MDNFCTICGSIIETGKYQCETCKLHKTKDLLPEYRVEPVFQWNWAAFSMPIIWCLVMRLWRWLAVLIAGNLIILWGCTSLGYYDYMPHIHLTISFNGLIGIILGASSSKMVYISRNWIDNVHFNSTLSLWTKVGKPVALLNLLLIISSFILLTTLEISSISNKSVPSTLFGWQVNEYLEEKGNDLNEHILDYFNNNNRTLPLNIDVDLVRSKSYEMYINPFTKLPAIQVPFNANSPGNYSYFILEDAYLNKGKVLDVATDPNFECFHLLVIHDKPYTGKSSDTLIYYSLKPSQSFGARILIDPLTNHKYRVDNRSCRFDVIKVD